MNKLRYLFGVVWLLALSVGFLLVPTAKAQAQADVPLAMVLTADGAVTPTMGEYLARGIRLAEQRDAEVLIFQLNTPGGGVDTMTDIVEIIRGSKIPVVVYVAPRGAIAGSAGTVITLAGHVAAMAPETAIGAASPVGAQGEDIGETMETKVKEILKAQVRSLAEGRGAEAVALAEATIEKATAVSASEALDAGLIDIIANDVHDLLSQLDGFTVETLEGERTLHTANAEVSRMDLTLIEQLLVVLTNPNIVFILLTIGVQSILIELSNPGGWVAGFIGVVCLSLAAYGLGVLPVNWFGLIFLVTAFVLFILDIKAPTHGALTAAGVGSLIVGALVLFNSPATPQFQRVSVPLVIVSSLITGGMFAVALAFAVRAQKTPIRTGRAALVGRVGVVKDEIPALGSGSVQMGGELWSAESAQGVPITPGSRVEVLSVSGIRLRVKKI
ncbi:MAG: nodulation protein NfeD [Anaerolineales bacterium]|nr:nodulation protein NfeD [Anaerolineales bacterium]